MHGKDWNNKNKVYIYLNNTKSHIINNWNKLALYFSISHTNSILINVYVLKNEKSFKICYVQAFLHVHFIFLPSSFLANAIFWDQWDDHPRTVSHARDHWWTLDLATAFLSKDVNSRTELVYIPSLRGYARNCAPRRWLGDYTSLNVPKKTLRFDSWKNNFKTALRSGSMFCIKFQVLLKVFSFFPCWNTAI
jgi:hypothetical protein